MASGASRNSQPIAVTPFCLLRIETPPGTALTRAPEAPIEPDFGRQPPGPASLDDRADAAPHRPARPSKVPIEPDPRRLADQVLLGHIPPGAAVVTVVAVVPHHHVVTGRHIADEGRHAHPSGRVLIAAHVAAHAVALAARQHWQAVDRHRTENRLVLVLAEV